MLIFAVTQSYITDGHVFYFSNGDYNGCLGSLERLEVLRPSDVKLAHNKIVAQCRADGSPVSLSEVVQQLDGLAKTAGQKIISLNFMELLENRCYSVPYVLCL